MGTCCEHVCEVFCARLKCSLVHVNICGLFFLFLTLREHAAILKKEKSLALGRWRWAS